MKLRANDVRGNDYLEVMDGPIKGRVAEGLVCMASRGSSAMAIA